MSGELFFLSVLVLNQVMPKQTSEANTLHLSEVAQGSSERLSSAASHSIPPSILQADMHT